MNLNINNLPKPLSSEEQNKTFDLFWSGDMEARKKLIKHNSRLVLQVIYDKYHPFLFALEDLFQEGMLILVRAVDLYDKTSGYQFSTYAYKSIYRSLLRSIKKIQASEQGFSTLINNDDDTYKLEELMLDHGSYVEEAVEYNNLESLFKTKLLDLPQDVKKVFCMRYGLFGCTPKTLNEIYNLVPYSRFQIFLMLKFALCEIFSKCFNKKLNDRDVDGELIKSIFFEYRSEKRNNDANDTRLISSFDSLYSIYSEDLYDKIVKAMNESQMRRIKVNKTGNYDIYFDGFNNHVCDFYEDIANYLNYGSTQINDTNYVTIYDDFTFCREEVDDGICRLNQELLRDLLSVYTLKLGVLYRKKNILKAADLRKKEKVCLEIQKNIECVKGVHRDLKNFYEYFGGSKGTVEFAISFLPLSVQKIIFKYVEFNLEKKVTVQEIDSLRKEVSILNIDLMEEIHKKIKEFYELSQKDANLVNYFSALNISNNEDIILNVLYSSDKEIIDSIESYLSGENDSNKNEFIVDALSKLGLKLIRSTIYSSPKVKSNTISTIYDYCFKYSKEQVDYVISLLDEDDKEMLFLRYGFDLESPNWKYWDYSLNKKFFKILVPKITNCLSRLYDGKKRKILTLRELFPSNNLLEIVCAASYLDSDYFLLLKKRYGENFDELSPTLLDANEGAKLSHVVLTRLGRILEAYNGVVKGVKVMPIYESCYPKEKSLVDEAIKLLDEKDYYILFIRNGVDLCNPKVQDEWYVDSVHYYSAYTSVVNKIKKRIELIENSQNFPESDPMSKVKKLYLEKVNI